MWLFLGYFSPSLSARVVTLQECLSKAARENPLVLKEAFEVKVAEETWEKARLGRYFPELKLRLMTGPVPDAKGSYLDPPDQFETSLSEKLKNLGPFFKAHFEGLQPLYTFGEIQSLINAAAAGVEAKQHTLHQRQAEVVEKMYKAYLGYQLSREVLEVQRELREEMNKILQKIDEWIASGAPYASQTDRLRFLVFLTLLDKEILASEKASRQSREAFLELCQEGSSDNEIEVQPLSEEPVSLISLPEAIEKALRDRPEVKALEAFAQAKKFLVEREKGRLYPRIFLAGGLRYGYSPGREPQENPFIDDDFNYLEGGIFLGLEQSLSFHLLRSEVSRAQAEYRQLLYAQEALKSGIVLEVTRNYENVRESEARVNKLREGVKAARTWMYAAAENYYLGVEKVSEVVDAFGSYLAVKWQFFQALYDYRKTLIEFSLSVGNKLWEGDE